MSMSETGEDIRDSRIIFDDRRGTTITAYLIGDSDITAPDGDCYSEADHAAFARGDWTYVGVVAAVEHYGVEIARASVWAVEHGTLGDVEADAFEWVPAHERPDNVLEMGSNLWGVTVEAVEEASTWVRGLAGKDGVWLARDRTALGAMEQFVAPRNDELMAELHGLALVENAERGKVRGWTLSVAHETIGRLINEGEGHRTLVFTALDGPEVWAVTNQVHDGIPGMIFVADVDVTEGGTR